jgi:hypothetical protein
MEWQKNLGQHSAANGQPSREQQTTHADVGPCSSDKLPVPVLLSLCSQRKHGPMPRMQPHPKQVVARAPMRCPVLHALQAERVLAHVTELPNSYKIKYDGPR